VTPPAGGAINLSYDQANRLTAYGTTSTYAYNGDSLRMSKTISGSTSQFLWNLAGSLPAMTKDGSTAYVNGPGGLPLEQMNGSTVIWLHHDQLGSTRLATDGVGATQATYAFDAYGNLTAASGTISNPFRFAGQYIDAESGLYYLQARYFDAGTGQFLSRDPAIVATRTPYEYVNDNPLNGVDPSGLVCWQFWDASKCNNPLTGKSHTAGVCFDIAYNWPGRGGKFDCCGVVRVENGKLVGVGTTETFGGGGAVGLGFSGSLNAQCSNAEQISSLGKQFTYFQAGAGTGPSGAASIAAGTDDCNRPVVVVEAGIGPGGGLATQVGGSWTYTQTWLGS
jgi:RHS repeat-associated protein